MRGGNGALESALRGSGPTSLGDWMAARPRHEALAVGIFWLLMLIDNCNNLRRY